MPALLFQFYAGQHLPHTVLQFPLQAAHIYPYAGTDLNSKALSLFQRSCPFCTILKLRNRNISSNGRYNAHNGSAVSATRKPLYFRYFGSERNGIFFLEESAVIPHLPFALASAMQLARYCIALSLKLPRYPKAVYMHIPSAIIGYHAFSAGIYSIKPFPARQA